MDETLIFRTKLRQQSLDVGGQIVDVEYVGLVYPIIEFGSEALEAGTELPGGCVRGFSMVDSPRALDTPLRSSDWLIGAVDALYR